MNMAALIFEKVVDDFFERMNEPKQNKVQKNETMKKGAKKEKGKRKKRNEC